jgi:hypothetical protein
LGHGCYAFLTDEVGMQRSYIKTVPSVVTGAMKRLEEKIACVADVQQVVVNGSVSF